MRVVDAAHPGEVEEVVDEDLHAVRPVDRVLDVLVRPGVELSPVAALQELGEAGDLAQRLLEVVGGHVGELLQLGVGPLEVGGLLVEAHARLLDERGFAYEPFAHGVDLRAEPAQVRRAGRGDGVLEVTGGDLADVRAEPCQRRGDAPAQPLEDQPGEAEDDQRDHTEDPVPQPHGGRQVVPGVGAVGLEFPLLLGQRGAHGVERGLALRGALGGQRRGRHGRGGGDGPGDPLLPGLRRVCDGLYVPQPAGVVVEQFGEPGGERLLVGEALLVGDQELRVAGESVAADSGLLIEQRRFEVDRGGQGGRLHVHQVPADGGRPGQDPGSRHAEQGQDHQGHGHAHPEPPPGRPPGRGLGARQPLFAGHLLTPFAVAAAPEHDAACIL
ncbi:hypothetical protein EES37_32785 [Streptomyces sp. ADI91-18]|nr:hypothetical protein EES37_32785 [Streptomyces sp. ADI91-18]